VFVEVRAGAVGLERIAESCCNGQVAGRFGVAGCGRGGGDSGLGV